MSWKSLMGTLYIICLCSMFNNLNVCFFTNHVSYCYPLSNKVQLIQIYWRCWNLSQSASGGRWAMTGQQPNAL